LRHGASNLFERTDARGATLRRMLGGIDDDVTRALEELPLFPLRGVVLFPGMALPLHVFEPRYRKMTRDALDGSRCISVVHVPDRNADMNGNPAICKVAGIGTIVSHEELPDGRFHLLVVGRARVKLQELPFREPYRRARAEVVQCEESEVEPIDLLSLKSAISAFGRVARRLDPAFDPSVPDGLTLASFSDACAARLVLDAAERQRILETPCVAARIQILTEVLTMQHHNLDLSAPELN
jgi:Lon protease-like protein